MKNKQIMSLWSGIFFLMTLLLMLFSWAGSVYGWQPVQSMLSEEGIRWGLNHVLNDYVQTSALGVVLVLFMGIGMGMRAGYYNVWKRICLKNHYVSRKERRSFILSLVIGMCYVLAILFFIPFLRNVTGTLLHSPFMNGWAYIVSLGLGLMGMVYGYASNNFRRINQVFDAMAYLITCNADYFVVLFFVVQFFSVLSYTQLALCLGMNDYMVNAVFSVCCYGPLVFCRNK